MNARVGDWLGCEAGQEPVPWEGDNPCIDARPGRCDPPPRLKAPAELPFRAGSSSPMVMVRRHPVLANRWPSSDLIKRQDPLCQAILSDHLIRSDIAPSSRQPPPSVPPFFPCQGEVLAEFSPQFSWKEGQCLVAPTASQTLVQLMAGYWSIRRTTYDNLKCDGGWRDG